MQVQERKDDHSILENAYFGTKSTDIAFFNDFLSALFPILTIEPGEVIHERLERVKLLIIATRTFEETCQHYHSFPNLYFDSQQFGTSKYSNYKYYYTTS